MKNAIKYYYNFNPTYIHQINQTYKFEYLGNKYMLIPITRTNEEIQDIYKLNMYLKTLGIYCNEIELNKENRIVTQISNKLYILLRITVKQRKIKMEDVLYMSNIPISVNLYKNIERKKWSELWSKKIDYIEYQISQFGKKYPLIRESSDYYIGIVENCISLLNNMQKENSKITIAHERIPEYYKTDDLYNPMNFILDISVRDISEYLKNYILEDINIINYIQNYIYLKKPTSNEIELMFIRIMYPTQYLDTCEQILEKSENEDVLLKIINNVDKYEMNIKKIYNYIKQIINLPEIEWLKKM